MYHSLEKFFMIVRSLILIVLHEALPGYKGECARIVNCSVIFRITSRPVSLPEKLVRSGEFSKL